MSTAESPQTGSGSGRKFITWRSLMMAAGPGLIFAGASIGVSHLVQSTRAGALFGFGLLWAVLVANLFKYPALEFGPRYATATGESLIEGYRRVGLWALILFLILTFATMFTIQAGVTLVTGSLATIAFGEINLPFFAAPAVAWSVILMLVMAVLLVAGRYPLLDLLVKIIVVVLTVSTVAAVVLMLVAGERTVAEDFTPTPMWDAAAIIFLVALIGWMPTTVDLSVWNSLWRQERTKQTAHRPTMWENQVDFNTGYIVTVLLAVVFLALGALVMYGTGESFEQGSVPFARQFLNLYATSLGEWSRPLVLAAAVTAMFSTSLACLDAFPRLLSRSTAVLFLGGAGDPRERFWYRSWLVVVFVGAVIVMQFFAATLTGLIDLAATLSFLVAPVFAWLNHLVVTSRHMPAEARPKPWLRVLSILGIIYLAVFAAGYIVFRVWLHYAG